MPSGARHGVCKLTHIPRQPRTEVYMNGGNCADMRCGGPAGVRAGIERAAGQHREPGSPGAAASLGAGTVSPAAGRGCPESEGLPPLPDPPHGQFQPA